MSNVYCLDQTDFLSFKGTLYFREVLSNLKKNKRSFILENLTPGFKMLSSIITRQCIKLSYKCPTCPQIQNKTSFEENEIKLVCYVET